MNRERKVADLYAAVKSITEPEAFQRVIAGEPEDFALADLRNKFWDGTGAKPWQVIEINRQLTRRKDALAQEARSTEESVRPKSLKERIENNLVVFFLAALLTGFLAGLGTYQGALKLVDYAPISNEALRQLKEDAESKAKTMAALDARVKTAESSVGTQRWLRIRGVEGLDGSRARLVARVNGRAYSYPSRAVWSRLGAGMPVEEFPLPIDVKAYDVSFELLTLSPDGQFQQFQSQEVISVRSWPFEHEYKIFALTIEKAGTAPGSTTPFSIGSVRGGTTREIRGATAKESDTTRERQALVRVAFEIR